jgi:hypothetical protein
MNEVQLLRQQIATERRHVREATAIRAAACPASHVTSRDAKLDLHLDISISYDNYLRYFFAKERARARAHIARLSRHAPLAPSEQAALTRLQRALEESADLEAMLAGAVAIAAETNGALAGNTALLCNLIDANETLEPLAERRYSVEDWRSVAQVDADSVLEERRLWAEVNRHGTITPGH